MIYDPNSVLAQSHETRVTARGVRLSPDTTETHQVSTRSDFVAPDMSPVSTNATEQEKGKRGWTNRDVKPAVVNINGGIVSGGTSPYTTPMSCGTSVIRKAPAATLVKRNVMGPSTRTRSKFCN